MDIKGQLQLSLPINFYDICTIHPLTVLDCLNMEDEEVSQLFLPYAGTKEILDEKYKDMDLYDVLVTDQTFLTHIATSLMFFCKTENVKINSKTLEIFIDDNTRSINKSNFEEFSQIILDIGHREKIKKQQPEIIPNFETQEGYDRWKKLKDLREKNKSLGNSQIPHIVDVINFVQFGGNSYITNTEIEKWTYWKLYAAYKTIANINNYNSSFKIYLQTGDKKLIEKHWSDLIKL